MSHIERGECILSFSDLLARREEMVEFNRRVNVLKGVKPSDLQLDLTHFMLDGPHKGCSVPPTAEPDSSVKDIPAGKSDTSHQNSEPRPSSLLKHCAAPKPPPSVKAHVTDPFKNSVQDSGWGSNDDILVANPRASEAIRLDDSEPTLDEAHCNDTTPIITPWDKNEGGWYGDGEEAPAVESDTAWALVQQTIVLEADNVIHDPDHAAFDITRYWNEHMQQYGCPRFPCW